jgi:hypothetical protein
LPSRWSPTFAPSSFRVTSSLWKPLLFGSNSPFLRDYNLALGDNRADTVRDQLESLGVASDRIRTISYGKEKPFCTEETEACWQLNRRAHFSLLR